MKFIPFANQLRRKAGTESDADDGLESRDWSRPLLRILLVSIMLAACAALALHAAARNSLTSDEPKHLATAVYHLKEGRCCLGHDNNPTLALNALPLLPGEHLGLQHLAPRSNPLLAGRAFLMAEPDLDDAVWKARLPSISLLIGLGLIVFAWSRRLYGTTGGLISMFLVAFSPNLLAHGSLVAGDIHAAFFMTLAAWTYARFFDRPGWGRAFVAGACLGLALSAKFSALVLIPSFAVLGLIGWSSLRSGVRRVLLAHAASLAGMVVLAFAVVWLAYGCTVSPTSLNGEGPLLAGFADYLDGLQHVRVLASSGWDSYLLGAYRSGGWWYYYPVAMAVKTPLPALLALTASVVLTPWIARPAWRTEAFLVLPVAVLVTTLLVSNLNIGIRHLLPVYPLLHIWAGRLALLRLVSRKVAAVLLVLAGTWYLVGTLSVHPHYLAYFNEAAGGPDGGHRILADSNVDWGQSLKELRRFLEREKVAAIRLSYFGPIAPEHYGIRYQPLPSFDVHPQQDLYIGDFDGRELVVVSTNNLLGIPPHLRGTYDWLRERDPVARPGHSLFVYDITGDLDAHRELIQIYRKSGMAFLEELESYRLRLATADGSDSGESP